MKDAILVISSAFDKSVELVISRLDAMGERVFRLNTDDFPRKVSIGMTFFGGELGGYLRHGDSVLPLNEVKSCWHRRSDRSKGFDDLPSGYLKFVKDESRAALWSLYTNLDAFWMNKPLIGSRLLENNKFLQMRIASQMGLAVPDTIVTNQPDTLLDFCRSNGGEVAMKMLSGHVFIAPSSPEKVRILYTQRVSEKQIEEHFENVRLAPVFAQEYVPKDVELRVTIVGEKLFACAIHSQDSEMTVDDWRRYDFDNVRHEIYQMPSSIEAKLMAFMRQLGLEFGAIDMIVTPSGDHVFLEVNPSGQWGWIEDLTGMPISDAIADLLANPST